MGRRLINRQYKLGSRAPSMQTITGDSGIANLSPYLTINGSTVSPTFLYYGNDATASTFPAQWGEALPITGTGAAPSLNQPAYGNGDNDSMVVGSADMNYTSLSSSYADSATDDIVLELVGFWDGTADFKTIIAKKSSSSAGYGIQFTPTGAISLIASDGTNNAISTSTDTIQAGTFFHYIGFIDKSGSICGYLNSAQTPAASAGAVGSMTTTSGLSLFAFTGSSNRSQSGIVSVSMWQQSAWLDTHLQAAVAAERFQKWSGIYPTKASGTAAPTYSRACSAYATKWNGTSYDLINCSAGLPRVDYVLDDSGTPFKGMLIEPQATNLLPYSNDINNAAWAKVLMGISTAETEETPASGIYYQGLVPDSTPSTAHYIDDVWVAGSAVAHTTSFYGKKETGSWILIYNSYSGSRVNFDLDNGVVGVTSGMDTADIIDTGNGHFLCTFTETVPAGNNLCRIIAEDDDNTGTMTGDDVSVHVWLSFLQVETGNKPTSRIYTAGASATRLADSLQYNGDNVTAGQGTIKCETLLDDYVNGTSVVYNINDASSNNTIYQYIAATNGRATYSGKDGGALQWFISGTTDLSDGNIHKLSMSWESNNAKQLVDGSFEGTPDTSCTIPTGLTDIDIGQNESSSSQLNGRIRNVAIYSFASSDV